MSAAWLRHSDFGDVAAELLVGRRPPSAAADRRRRGVRLPRPGRSAVRRGADRPYDTVSSPAPPRTRPGTWPASRPGSCGSACEGLLEEAIAAAFDAPQASVRRALMLLGEPGEVATMARRGTLDQATLHLGRPIRPMLATPVGDADEVMRRVGDEAWIEDKYDGIRAQLHLVRRSARLFSRDLKEITVSFPEVATATGAWTTSSCSTASSCPSGREPCSTSPRSRPGSAGSGPMAALLEKVPVVFVAFDLLHLDGEDLLEHPLRDRRTALEGSPCRTGPMPASCARLDRARSADEVDARFDEARERHNEGLMVKDPTSVYQPGRRGLGWLKLKKALATLDCVVVGVEWGHGKRRGVLSDYTFAVRTTDAHGGSLVGHWEGLHRPDRCRDRPIHRALPADDRPRLRSVPERGARGRGRDRIRPDHAQRAARQRVRPPVPADRAHPRRQDRPPISTPSTPSRGCSTRRPAAGSCSPPGGADGAHLGGRLRR